MLKLIIANMIGYLLATLLFTLLIHIIKLIMILFDK